MALFWFLTYAIIGVGDPTWRAVCERLGAALKEVADPLDSNVTVLV